jgi:hypothetical protein
MKGLVGRTLSLLVLHYDQQLSVLHKNTPHSRLGVAPSNGPYFSAPAGHAGHKVDAEQQ